MEPRKRLSEIVQHLAALKSAWASTKPAADLAPLPPGPYTCSLDDIRPDASRSGTPRLKITLTVKDGEHAGRRVFHDAYLSVAAIPFTLRLLGKVGLDDLDLIDRGIPPGIVVRAKVVQRSRDDGETFNEVRDWSLVAVESPPPAADPAPWVVDPAAADGTTPKGDADDFP